MKYNLLYLSLLLIYISKIESQNIRFTISGNQCYFPVKYNGIEYNNCILNEKGQEWCYIDKLNASWDYCARGDFKIDTSILIKNINIKDKHEYCLFIVDNNLFSTYCELLIEIKKNKLENLIDINNFEFYWINESQIKTKKERCLQPIETPIIENNKIAYYGYVEIKNCIINDDLSISNEQKWKIDENGHIINNYLKKCIIRSNQTIKLVEIIKTDIDYDIYKINLGDCIGNSIGYGGNEIWVIEQYHPEKMELMAMEKLVRMYKEGGNKMDDIIKKSNKNFLKLIDYNSRLIDFKNIIDKSENYLESADKNLDNIEFERRLNQTNSHSNTLHGLSMKCFSHNVTDYIISGISITNSKLKIYNFLKLFMKIYDDEIYNIDLCNKVLITGYLLNNQRSPFKLKTETNRNFILSINNNIIFKIINNEKNNIFNSDEIKLNSNSLNKIQILFKNTKNLEFNISIVKGTFIEELKVNNFIPFKPLYDYKLSKSQILDSIDNIKCNENNIKTNRILLCNKDCDIDGICKNSFNSGEITKNGGLLILQDNKIKRFLFNYIGIDYLISDLKLGYIDEYKKYSKDSNSQIFKDYQIKIDLNNKDDDSFLFYKKEIITEGDYYVVIDAKLICQNSNYNNTFNSKFKTEKLHDMINGFTILVIKIKYNDLDPSQRYLEDLRINYYHNKEMYYSDLSYNKYVCKSNNKLIVLENRYNTKTYFKYIDYYADSNTHESEIMSYLIKMRKNELNINCNIINIKTESICNTAVKKDIIPIRGGNFKIKKFSKSLEYYILNDYPILQVNLKSKYRIYDTILEIDDKSKFTSFLQINSSKFYSNDLLLKLEQGLNQVTDKIIEQSKKMTEVDKINYDFEKKLKKLEEGENSIDIVNKRVSEITKLEINLEERLNKKFLKYQEMIDSKDEIILDIKHNNNLFYDLKNDNNLIDWIIFDTIDSKSGPSDWDIVSNTLIQNSSIYNDNNLPASTMLYNREIRNLYCSIIFLTKSIGSIFINFKYIDYNNYLSLRLKRISDEKGDIDIVRIKEGKTKELITLNCDKMLTIMGKCIGYQLNKNNNIEIFTYGKKVIVLYNSFEIFNLEVDEIWDSKFSLSINNQNSLTITKMVLKELSIQEYIKLNKQTDNVKILKDEAPLQIAEYKNDSLKYNAITNNFENITKDKENININVIKPEEDILDLCLKHEKEKYICNYLSNVYKNYKIKKETNNEAIVTIIRTNCLETMKNVSFCDQILKKINPVLIKLKEESTMTRKRDIKNLILACNMDFLPPLLKNRKVCLNDMLKREINERISNSNDNCIKEFCENCCFINYGNFQCNICNKQ